MSGSRSNKSALPYRADHEVDSNLDASNNPTANSGNISDDPVLEKFNQKNINKGGRIMINKKGVTQSHHDNIRKIRERMTTDASSRLDEEMNIEVNLPM